MLAGEDKSTIFKQKEIFFLKMVVWDITDPEKSQIGKETIFL